MLSIDLAVKSLHSCLPDRKHWKHPHRSSWTFRPGWERDHSFWERFSVCDSGLSQTHSAALALLEWDILLPLTPQARVKTAGLWIQRRLAATHRGLPPNLSGKRFASKKHPLSWMGGFPIHWEPKTGDKGLYCTTKEDRCPGMVTPWSLASLWL